MPKKGKEAGLSEEDSQNIGQNIVENMKSLEEKNEDLRKEIDKLKNIIKEIESKSDSVIISESKSDSNLNEDSDSLGDIIMKSSVFAGSEYWEIFKSLDGMNQLAISLLILNYVIMSALTSLVAVFFSNYLITRFNLEVKYPKLAKYIRLRAKFQRYYLITSILCIAVISLAQIWFALFILFS